MEPTQLVRRFPSGVIVAVLLAFSFAGWGRADDVTTLSGTTLHDVRLVRTEPDGVVWEHATGMAKIDFTDLPEAVRRQYHYDAVKATALRAARAQEQALFAAQAQRIQREAEVHRVQRFEAQTNLDHATTARPGEFVYRNRAAATATEDSVVGTLAAKKATEDFRTKDDGTMWDRRLWAVPKFLFGSSPFNGVAFDPKTDFNSHEFQVGAHHAPGGFAADSAHDAFFQPIYETKSYYEDVERAEAFARGSP